MSSFRRLLVSAFALMLALMLVGPITNPLAARADDSVIVPDPTDVLMGQGIDPETDSLTAIESCWDEAGDNADNTWISYGEVSSAPPYLDEYDPSGTGDHPAAVLVHGGGWRGGCRVWMDSLAYHLSHDDGYMVFNIDYRLSCTVPNVYVCAGVHATAPVNDVKWAVSWARQHAADYDGENQTFNGKVALIGGSAGGNLSYMAGVTGLDGNSKPDVMAGFSGHPEMGYMTDGIPACDEAPIEEQDLCWDNSEQYMGFALSGTDSQCQDDWAFASPACNIDPDNLPPPTYIANATEELSACQAAVDFQGFLDYWDVPNRLCTVDGSDHGTELFTDTCNESSTTAYAYMIDFFDPYVW